MTNLIQRARGVPAARALPARYTTPLPHLARVRLLTGAQLDQLLASPDTTAATTARLRRRIMTRLSDLGLVATLQRRIGGVRAGSAGHIYTLTPAGHRFLAMSNGKPCPPRSRPPATPSPLFLAHTLAISDTYVRLINATRDHPVAMQCFMTEPYCWQPTGHSDYLKPDAYCVLAATTHQDCWWLEIDQDTQSLPRVRAKCRAYLDFLAHGGTGPDKVPPRVLYTTPTMQRCEAIKKIITQLSIQDSNLIDAITHTDAPQFLITELAES